MTNKIVILDDSVILYEHYISDDKWERTLAFPRGGLTYLVSNGTVKFYAYEDYFYRNCLISMQLPIYIVDDYMHIDGEYENIKDLTEVLDRIFPTNDMDAELSKYLKIVDAELLYQPIGDYALKSDIPDISDLVTTEELVEALDDYYTKEESDARFQPKGDYATKDELDLKADKDDVYTKTESDNKYQPKGDYLTSADTYVKDEIDDKLDDKLDASAYTPCDLSNYYTKQETSSKTQIDTALARKADNDKVYTKTESDNKYQPKGNYQEKLIAGANITISGNVISASGGGGEPVDAYTKAESDARYQPKGDYATEQWVLNQKYITSSSTVFNNYYTTANTYNKTEINNYITQLQNQINSLQEALEECCSCDIQYRWITLTGTSDYICDYQTHTKYEKQQKQQSTNCGRSWTNVIPSEYQRGSIIETSSVDCGYVPEGDRLIMTDATGGTYTLYCSAEHPETTDYLDLHGVKDLTYFDGTTMTVISGFPSNEIKQSIVDIEVGECVNTLGGQTFMDYSGVTSVTLPDSLVYMYTSGYGNFENCASLECINIPDSVTYIAPRNFRGCSRLSKIVIGSGCTNIGDYTFSGCTSLNDIYIKATTPPTIVDVSLSGIDNLANIYVPISSVNAYKTANYWNAFADKITGVDIFPSDCGDVPPTPESMKWLATHSGGTTSSAECDSTSAITNGEISDWRKTVSVEIGECVTTIGDLAFHGFLSLSGITIPNNVTSIGSQAFEQCIGLTTCSIGNGVTSIGVSSFGGCTGLTTINIPDSVTSLDQSAFHNCTSLTSVTIGSGCTSIGSTCFGSCGNISTFTCKATTPPSLGGTVFGDTTVGVIYVPAQSVNAYKSANRWSDYSSIIQAIPS